MLQAIGTNVVLKRIETELESRGKKAGLLMPTNKKRDGMKTVFVRGEVVSVGAKFSHDTMSSLKEGDVVIYNPFDEDDWDGLKIVNGGAVVAKLE